MIIVEFTNLMNTLYWIRATSSLLYVTFKTCQPIDGVFFQTNVPEITRKDAVYMYIE